MKKLFCIFFALILAIALIGCGGADKEDGSADTSASTAGDVAENTEKTPEDTKAEASDDVDTSVFDHELCSIKLVGFEKDDYYGNVVTVEYENKTADQNHMYTVKYANVNGVQCETLGITTVEAGKSVTDEVVISTEVAEIYGMTEITDIELVIDVSNADDMSAIEEISEVSLNYYPNGKENATDFVREAVATEKVVAENDHVKFTYVETIIDDLGGYNYVFYVENKSDKNISLTGSSAYVNETKIDTLYSDMVGAGNKKFTVMYWDEATLAGVGASTVEKLEANVWVMDDDVMSADYGTLNIVVTP